MGGRLGLMAAASLLLCTTMADATDQGADVAERRLVIIDGADYFGHDYDTLRDVDQSRCESACLADPRCQAFTFNRSIGWCFLKDAHDALRAYDGAVSGRIVTGPSDAETERRAERASELAFLQPRYRNEADDLAERIAEADAGIDGSFDDLIAEARNAAMADPRRAAELYRVALRLEPGDTDLWLRLAETSLAVETNDWSLRRRLQEQATAAAINAYLTSATPAERARALELIGRTLEVRSAWRPAIQAARAALGIRSNPTLRSHLDQLVARHGFRVTDHSISSDARDPRICVQFSDPLDLDTDNLADYVQLDQQGLAVESEALQICIDGVRHGERYGIRIREGLPANDGERLAKPVDLDVYVRDRSPAVRFPGRAYVLPKGGEPTLPIVTINTETVDAALYRVGDRALGGLVADDALFGQLSGYEAEDIAERRGERLWQGIIEVRSELNKEVTTAVPVAELLAEAADDGQPAAMQPGSYILTARPSESPDDGTLATQWFVVSDLGLTSMAGDDGLHAFVRSLSTAEPVAGVALRLVALNQQVLGRAVTDDLGYARLEPGLLRGDGGNAPALLVAEGPSGDYGFLDLKGAPFDLTDRGVDGRPAPGPVDVYLVSERGIYRPGETVTMTALTRDARAHAVTDLPLTFVVRRPDGVEHRREQARDKGLGGHRLEVPMLDDAMRGTWTADVYTDPKAEPLARVGFLVEDFEPERLDFALEPSAVVIDPRDPPTIAVDARFLYGAPAANLDVEGQARVRAADGLPGWSGWRFGLNDEEVPERSAPLPPAETDAAGRARVQVELPDLAPVSRLREAEIAVRVIDGSGRPVEREQTLPIDDRRPRVGLKPLFDGAVEQGGNARFEVIALGTDGQPIPAAGLTWTLSRVQTSYQWYRTDGDWRFEPFVSRSRAASGSFDVRDDGGNPAQIEVPVDWGSYELTVSTAGNRLVPASVGFEAGWYVQPKAFDTPDVLKVSLDQAEYQVGDTARVRLEPRFPGLALVMVVGDGLVAMEPVDVPEDGTTVELPVTKDWGPGAYVTAMLYRGMDLKAKRMPRRAIGLHWAGVDPGDRRLDLDLVLPDQAEPRGPLTIGATIGNLPADGDAYLTIAAVDNGILNLTDFDSWAPAAWYFGQRKLGVAIRDLYGRLIDRMQGEPGRLRSGSGARMLMSFDGPPPSEALVAFQSGILKADDQGRAETQLDLPDFNGSVRVMAMAWSAAGIGQASKDVIVRDPIVVTAAMPRFLAPGDRSRILVELAHVEGPAGQMKVALTTNGQSLSVDNDGTPLLVDVPEQGRAQVSYDVEALTVGDTELTITLVLPDEKELNKDLVLGVRSLEPTVQQTQATTLDPGGEGLTLDAAALADAEGGFMPGTGAWLVSVSGAGALDIPGLLQALDRVPYGCTEQVTSLALPLLYLDPVAAAVGLGGTELGAAGADGDDQQSNITERIDKAIAQVLASQASSGGFGLWGPGGRAGSSSADLWLDAYVGDFLTRAREQGHAVPDSAFNLAIDNLRNQVGYAPDFERGGEGVAYALYVLARNGRVPVGDLRWYQETKLDAFATPMARAQLGAALALYGETRRAARALRSALTLWQDGDDGTGWRPDFGSRIRDGAALLTLAAETGTDAIDLDALADKLDRAWSRAEHTSTQDQAWLLLAAHAMTEGAAKPKLSVNGEPHDGALYRRLDEVDLAAEALTIANTGDRPLTAVVTASGIPVEPPPAGGTGYRIERSYFGLDGTPVDPAQVQQGTRMIVLLTIKADTQRAARLIINDPLPAGLEIDNPNLISAGAVDGLPWLDVVEQPAHVAFRAERFVAAVDREKRDPRQFQLAYAVRAVSPGSFARPAATVEDMYRPTLRGRTESGRTKVIGVEASAGSED